MHIPPNVYISHNIGKNNKLPKCASFNNGKAKNNILTAS